ncbi:hypothetical protein M408DRAFT_316497 [Serendipita vermifera MAFF 305830]|uniref:Uncharacterized protein n=1 Tax=Serendipita vermifera MAFF 305830 TaxID=933852 RepID=A0A0C2X7K0_SERVB|nr:hypothetical protein M408DRAFT_316497 [Serendipita vermifera MAFF 305830]
MTRIKKRVWSRGEVRCNPMWNLWGVGCSLLHKMFSRPDVAIPHGRLYLLARSFEDPQKLNHRGYSLYCDFRPDGGGWGAKGDVKLEQILRLREGIKPAAADHKSIKEVRDLTPISQDQREPVTFEAFEANEEGDFSLWDFYDGED